MTDFKPTPASQFKRLIYALFGVAYQLGKLLIKKVTK